MMVVAWLFGRELLSLSVLLLNWMLFIERMVVIVERMITYSCCFGFRFPSLKHKVNFNDNEKFSKIKLSFKFECLRVQSLIVHGCC